MFPEFFNMTDVILNNGHFLAKDISMCLIQYIKVFAQSFAKWWGVSLLSILYFNFQNISTKEKYKLFYNTMCDNTKKKIL